MEPVGRARNGTTIGSQPPGAAPLFPRSRELRGSTGGIVVFPFPARVKEPAPHRRTHAMAIKRNTRKVTNPDEAIETTVRAEVQLDVEETPLPRTDVDDDDTEL